MGSVASVVDGQLDISESSQQTERKTGSSLDKDDFLMLLVTQMKYQDPLEPTNNTEYVAQLAQFSELEQMQNLNTTTVNTSAFSLVGKTVYIEQTSATGNIAEVEGVVDYVSIQNGTAYVSVNGELYSYDDIVNVIDSTYYISQFQPSVMQQSLIFMHQDAQDIKINGVNLGEDAYAATSIGICLIDASGNTINIDAKNLTYKDGTLTISKEALSSVPAGSYNIAFVFDDALSTVDYSSVTLTVKGIITASDDESSNSTEDAAESSTEAEEV